MAKAIFFTPNNYMQIVLTSHKSTYFKELSNTPANLVHYPSLVI